MLAAPFTAAAFSLVNCGQTNPATGKVDKPCEFKDLILLIVRLVNYLISVAAVVAMYYVLLGGFSLVTALGNPDKIKSSREGLTHAILGFALIVMAFVIVNLLVNGVLGIPGGERKWYDPVCIYGVGDKNAANGCPLGISGAKP